MGWWSTSIMGGDTPLDVSDGFNREFGIQKPTPEKTLKFINELEKAWGSGDIIRQATGFLMIQRGAPMNDELRTEILRGIDEEIEGGCDYWNNPEERLTVLRDFRKIVEAYGKGEDVTLPHQRGLMEVIDDHLK